MRVLALLLVIAAACGDNDTRCVGGVHVCGGSLRDPDGRAWILRGVNLAGAHKQAPYGDSFGAADYMRLRTDWGFNAIRFVMPWAAVEPEQGQFDDAYLDQVVERMRWAKDAGLAVVIDMHQDVYGEGFGYDGAPRWTCDASYYAAFVPRDPWTLAYSDPNVVACFDHLWTDTATQDELVAAWRHVAQRLASSPAVIGFDILNEPYWGSYGVSTFEREHLEPFYQRVIAQVRAVAPSWIVFAEPSGSRNLGIATSLVPFGVRDVVYAPHLYDAAAEASGQFDPSHRDALIASAADLRGEADRLDAALWIGEYGGQGSDPNIAAYMDAAYAAAGSAAASSIYWSYDRGGGYALLDAQGGEVAPLVAAVVRPYPARIAGDPIGWSYDAASRVLEVRWHPDPHATAPTVIIAPARVYPQGVTVDCGGCSVERDGDEVHLGRLTGDPAVARIAPQ